MPHSDLDNLQLADISSTSILSEIINNCLGPCLEEDSAAEQCCSSNSEMTEASLDHEVTPCSSSASTSTAAVHCGSTRTHLDQFEETVCSLIADVSVTNSNSTVESGCIVYDDGKKVKISQILNYNHTANALQKTDQRDLLLGKYLETKQCILSIIYVSSNFGLYILPIPS